MRYYIIAGEASGDLHGSNLLRGLYAEDPEAVIRFWGGGMMKEIANQFGNDGGLVRDYAENAVMGISQVVAKAGQLLGNLRFCKKDILSFRPDVVILIDYPGFNMKIAHFAHSKGLKVFYYIAPKTWASREGRNRKLKKWVDKLFIVFPFEIPYFSKRNIPYIYKGNPLVDAVDGSASMTETPEEFFARHALVQSPCIALLAGSRKDEIARTLPIDMQLADRLHSLPRYKDYRFLVAGAPSRSREEYEAIIGDRPYVSLIFGDTYSILRWSEAAVINSGTASLEAVLVGTPQVVVWSTSSFNAFVGLRILRVFDHIKYISLGNLIDDSLVFKELIQWYFTPEAVEAEIRQLIENEPYRAQMLDGYARIREALGGRGASRAVAKAMIEEL